MTSLNYVGVCVTLIPTVYGLSSWKSFTVPLRMLTVVYVFGSSVDIWSNYAALNKIHTIWIQNIYSIVEAVLLVLMLYNWKKAKWYRITAIILLSIYLFLWFYKTFTLGLDAYAGATHTLKSIFMMFLFSGVLIDLSFDTAIPVYKNYKFWISSALLLYFSIAVVLWSTAYLPIGDAVVQYYSWEFHTFLNMFCNLLVVYGLITFNRWKAIYS